MRESLHEPWDKNGPRVRWWKVAGGRREKIVNVKVKVNGEIRFKLRLRGA
jgi:hypothetical protein